MRRRLARTAATRCVADMNETEQDIEILDKEIVYQGFFQLERYRLRHRLYAGGMSGIVTRELLERGHAAAVLPYDPRRDEILLIEQFLDFALGIADYCYVMENGQIVSRGNANELDPEIVREHLSV